MRPWSLPLPQGPALYIYMHECNLNVLNDTVNASQHKHDLNMNLAWQSDLLGCDVERRVPTRWSNNTTEHQGGGQIDRSSLKCFVTGFVMNPPETTADYHDRWREKRRKKQACILLNAETCLWQMCLFPQTDLCTGGKKRYSDVLSAIINLCTCSSFEKRITKLCSIAIVSFLYGLKGV